MALLGSPVSKAPQFANRQLRESIVAAANEELPGLAETVALCGKRPARRTKQDLARFASAFVLRNRTKLGLLAEMNHHVLLKLAQLVKCDVIPAGTTLYEQGETGLAMHLLVHGKLGVYVAAEAPASVPTPKAANGAPLSVAKSESVSASVDKQTLEAVARATRLLEEAKVAALAAPGARRHPTVKIGLCNTSVSSDSPGLPLSGGMHLIGAPGVDRQLSAVAAGRHARGVLQRAPRPFTPSSNPEDDAARSDSATQRVRRGSTRSVSSASGRPALSSTRRGTVAPDRQPVRRSWAFTLPLIAATMGSSAATASQVLGGSPAAGAGDEDTPEVMVRYFSSGMARRVGTMRAPKAFGEVALRSRLHKRTATIVADTDCIALAISLRDIMEHASLAGILATNTEQYKFLAKLPWAARLHSEDITFMAYNLKPAKVQARTLLLREGEVSPILYIILKGTFRVSVRLDTATLARAAASAARAGSSLDSHALNRLKARRLVVAELGPGETVGERAAILGMPEEFDVEALGDATVLEVPVSEMQGILARVAPQLLRQAALKDAHRAAKLRMAARADSESVAAALHGSDFADFLPKASTERATTAPARRSTPNSKAQTGAARPPVAPTTGKRAATQPFPGSRFCATRDPVAQTSHFALQESLSKRLFAASAIPPSPSACSEDTKEPDGDTAACPRLIAGAVTAARRRQGRGSVVERPRHSGRFLRTGSISSSTCEGGAVPRPELRLSSPLRLDTGPAFRMIEAPATPTPSGFGVSGMTPGSTLKGRTPFSDSPIASRSPSRSSTQRVRLAAELGSPLADATFVADTYSFSPSARSRTPLVRRDEWPSPPPLHGLRSEPLPKGRLRRGSSIRHGLHGGNAEPMHGLSAPGARADHVLVASMEEGSPTGLNVQSGDASEEATFSRNVFSSASTPSNIVRSPQHKLPPPPVSALLPAPRSPPAGVAWRGSEAWTSKRRPATAMILRDIGHHGVKRTEGGRSRTRSDAGTGSRRAASLQMSAPRLQFAKAVESAERMVREAEELLEQGKPRDPSREYLRHESLNRRPLRKMGVRLDPGAKMGGKHLLHKPGYRIGPPCEDRPR